MNIIIYGHIDERESLCSMIESHGALLFRQKQCTFYDNYDEFLREIQRQVPELVIITTDGANGMEGVIATRELHPKVKIIWFSDDKAFGPQSYRLDCTYFAVKPITEHILSKALAQI